VLSRFTVRRPPEPPGAEPPSPEEVDRVLDKILEEGIESLTDRERRVLERAGRKEE
jgi:hypothetical protein